MRVKCSDGKIFEGKNYRDVVEKIRADSWFPEATKALWMRAAARRAEVQTGAVVSVPETGKVTEKDAKTFICDLVDAALLTILEL
jgi:hypothetical protein